MIAILHGKVIQLGEKTAILDVQGVGYELFLSPNVRASLNVDQNITLHTYLNVREDAMELYGFQSAAERSFFKQLISISGVGPKSALGVLAVASLDEVKRAVASGDASMLTKVAGIGRKTAERIVVELKEKLVGEVLESQGATAGDGGILEALQGLGYSLMEAREAVRGIPATVEGFDERLKVALKMIGKS